MSECTDWMTEVRWKLASVSAYGRRDVYEGLNVARNEVKRNWGWREILYSRSITQYFWWRCGQGTHPFPSRTRWLRPDRPMVLHWRRCGRAGGRQIKKKTTGWKPDEDKTGIGKWVLSETGWSQIRIVKSGANPYQPGRAVKICWFYQWLEILNKKSRRRNIWCF